MSLSLENEIWLPVDGYKGYEVSNFGRVKSLSRDVDRGIKGILRKKDKILSLKNTNGYTQVVLHRNAIRKMFLVHRLVASAFIENHLNKKQVNHKNGVRNDNRVSNLEWVTSSENQIHAYETGLQKVSFGEGRGRVCKLKEYQVMEIKYLIKNGVKLKDIAWFFNVNPVTISNIKTKSTWRRAISWA